MPPPHHHASLRLGLPSPTLAPGRPCNNRRTQLSLLAPKTSSSSDPLRHLTLTLTSPPTPTPTFTLTKTDCFNRMQPQVEKYLRDKLRIDPHIALAANISLLSGSSDAHIAGTADIANANESDFLSLIRHSHHLLLAAGLPPALISRLFSCQPLLLSHPHLIGPSLAFLRPLFLPDQFPLCLSRNPRLLLCPVRSQLSPTFFFLRSHLSLPLPFTPSIASLLSADVETTLLPKLHFLQSSLGTNTPSCEIRHILRKFPKLLTLNINNNLQPKLHFLKHHMRLDPRTEIRSFPQYFAFNLEHKIKRRYRVLTDAGLRMSLKAMLIPSDGAFDQTVLDIKLRSMDDIITRKARLRQSIIIPA